MGGQILEVKNWYRYDLKGHPKAPYLKKLQFDELDHQEDTQGVVLSHIQASIHHITESFIVILAKNVKICHKLSLLWPLEFKGRV